MIRPAVALLVSAWLAPSAWAVTPQHELVEPVFADLQAARADAGAPALKRNAAFDRLAARQARHLAGQPRKRRLAGGLPLEALLQDEGIHFREAFQHVDLKRGYHDMAQAFRRGWREHQGSWRNALDPRVTAVGLACVGADDGWSVLVAVLVVERSTTWNAKKLERQVWRRINRIREERGLAALRLDDRLTRAAREHSRDMQRRGYFDHVDPAGRQASDRARAEGVAFTLLAENIQLNDDPDDPAAAAVESWMLSPGHRSNILDRTFTHTGIGVSVADDGTATFTQMFLLP